MYFFKSTHTMSIAENKKKNNISEYIIFMYQTEDLIRVYNFDMDQIKQYVIAHFPVDDDEKESLVKWYEDILNQMLKENIKESGHLSKVNKISSELGELSNQLLKSDQAYRQIYDRAKIDINKNMALSKGTIKDPIQICLNAIYGLLLLRINGKQLDESLKEGITAFGDVLSYLSYKYKQRKSSPTD